MQMKTILNRIQKNKGFVYGKASFVGKKIEVPIRARENSRPICSGCDQRGSTYDTRPPRRFTFVPMWGIGVYFVYAMRRVNCPRCGVTVERVPWAAGKSPRTQAYSLFLATWARRLSWREVAVVFKTSWESVYRSVSWVVEYGLAHRSLEGVTAIGVDEVQVHKGQRYYTAVYQIDKHQRRLLWVGKDRTTETLQKFFELLGAEGAAKLRFVCSDMWQPYLNVIRERAKDALHILDRFHIVAMLNKAVDEIRAAEAKELAREGYEPVLKHSRWCFLKRPKNLTGKQRRKLRDLMRYSLKSVRAYLLKEGFQIFWKYKCPIWAGCYLDAWLASAMRSRLEPIKKVARSVRDHRELILNWFRAKKEFNSGIVEGLNYRIKLSIRKAYGFKTSKALKIALYHTLAALPEPPIAHSFC